MRNQSQKKMCRFGDFLSQKIILDFDTRALFLPLTGFAFNLFMKTTISPSRRLNNECFLFLFFSQMRWFKNDQVGKMTVSKNLTLILTVIFSIYHYKHKALSWSYFECIRKKKKMKHSKLICHQNTIDGVTLAAAKFAVSDKKYKQATLKSE